MNIHQLPISLHQRPQPIDPELGEQLLFDAIALDAAHESKRTYLERKWMEMLCALDDGDEMLVFETSGIGTAKKKGLARARNGEVFEVLMLP